MSSKLKIRLLHYHSKANKERSYEARLLNDVKSRMYRYYREQKWRSTSQRQIAVIGQQRVREGAYRVLPT